MDRGARNNKGRCISVILILRYTMCQFFKKVVHLVRDPRAILSSMLHERKTWSKTIADFKEACDLMYEDLTMEKNIPSSR